MATKKPKSSKAQKAKTTKPKTAAKTVEKPVSEAVKTNTVEKTTNEKVVSSDAKKSCLKGFFAKKYEENESILTIFKNHKFYGALLGEIIGMTLLTLLLFSFTLAGGLTGFTTSIFVIIAIYIAIYAFSGACLNPIIVVGMMASRRMSVIRGIMYIIAEIVGAWLGWLIFNSFHLAGGDTAMDVPALTAVGENQFWVFAMVELLGAVIIAFFFARALKYKRSTFTFAATVAGGIAVAIMVGFVVSAGFLQLQNNFIFNPAAALMFQIFPTAGNGFGEIMGGIMQALSIYMILPMVGGVIGFYLSDFTSKLSSEE